MKKLFFIYSCVLLTAVYMMAYSEGHVEITSKGTANVRSKADTESQVVGRVSPGDVFLFTEISDNGWYRIVLNDGTEGYISGKMVKVVDGTAQGISSKPVSSTSPMSLFKVDSKVTGADFGSDPNLVAQEFKISNNDLYGTIFLDVSSDAKKISFAGVRIHFMQPEYKKVGDTEALWGMNITVPYTSKSTENLTTMKNAISKVFGKAETVEKGHSTSGIYINGRALSESSSWQMQYKWENDSDIITIDYSAKKDKKTVIKDTELSISIDHKGEPNRNITENNDALGNSQANMTAEYIPAAGPVPFSLFEIDTSMPNVSMKSSREEIRNAFKITSNKTEQELIDSFNLAFDSNAQTVTFCGIPIRNIGFYWSNAGELTRIEIQIHGLREDFIAMRDNLIKALNNQSKYDTEQTNSISGIVTKCRWACTNGITIEIVDNVRYLGDIMITIR